MELSAFVRSGGGMVVANRCWNTQLSELFGLGVNAAEPSMQVSTGLSIDTEVFAGSAGLNVSDADWLIEHSRLVIGRADLSPDCVILISDCAGNPILWRRDFGRGRLAYWNTSALFWRVLRGFFVQTVLDTMDVGVSAIAGFAMFHIDDFPTSLSDARLEPVTSEFEDLDWDGFFFGVWHKDMMALREKHDLKYSWYAIMNYDDVDNGRDADLSAPALLGGRQILQQRFTRIRQFAEDDEFGFHGYNHEPMTDDFWPDKATLRSKLAVARSLWSDCVPVPLPTSWVPANNWYHADHVRALKAVFPEISVVCGLFSTGDTANGGYREFGPEPWINELLCLPRDTYGYVLRPDVRMMMLSQIAGMGVWTHFVHPDDIYDIPGKSGESGYCRNPETLCWRTTNTASQPGLLTQLDAWIAQVRDTYPWLEFVTTSRAEAKYHAHINNRVEVRIAGKQIEILSSSAGLFYVKTRKEKSLVAGAGGEIVDQRQIEGGLLYVVRCTAGGGIFLIHEE